MIIKKTLNVNKARKCLFNKSRWNKDKNKVQSVRAWGNIKILFKSEKTHCALQSQIRTIIFYEEQITNDSEINKEICYFYKSL